MGNEIVKSFNTADQKLMASFVNGVSDSLRNLGLNLNDYQMACAKNAFKRIYDLCQDNEVNINDVKDDISTFIERAAMFKLNALAIPAECYIIVRNANKKGKRPYLEFGVEGDGNDRMLAEYGKNIERVYPYWLVRENDDFTFPSFKGLEVIPPTWTPKDYHSKVVRVVYPIKYNDGTVQYHISERESVKNNLLAHINQNLMGEYFGIQTFNKSGDALKDAKAEQNEKRKAIIDGVKDKTLEEILEDPSVQPYLSPSWRSPHSRESMIIRKMRNNVTKPITKDLGSAYVYDAFKKTFDDYEQYEEKEDPRINKEEAVEAEIIEQSGTEHIETPKEVIKEKAAPRPESSDSEPEDDEECPF